MSGKENKEEIDQIQHLINLVNIVRKSRKKEKINEAFNEIISILDVKIKQISYKINIAGFGFNDIYQEALYALRYKAIKDYDPDRGSTDEPYPFDKFAMLCMRRHLATIRKTSYQNKKKVLNFSISLDQERGDYGGAGEDQFTLMDLIPQTTGSVIDKIEKTEYYKQLFDSLFEKLSSFEREVFILYIKKYSYEQITKIINKKRNIMQNRKIDVKSVDNAIVRIKHKSKNVLMYYDD